MGFQKAIRNAIAAAIPGALVEASDAYKYLRKGVVGAGNVVHIGKFVVYDNAIKGYRDVKTGDTEDKIAGICVLNAYTTAESNTSIYNAGESVVIAENGIVAVSVNSDAGDNDKVTIDLDNGNVFVGTPKTAPTNKLELTKFKCVQHTGLGDSTSGIAFIKA